jgi:hypothetical protein
MHFTIWFDGASGEVHVFLCSNGETNSNWNQFEYHNLMNNPNVASIIFHPYS